jgi:hypothetical protein
MDRSAVQAIVDRELGPLLARLGIDHWKVRCSYAPAPDQDDGCTLRGECTRLLDYHDAFIRFNPEAFEDEDGVLVTLRHELYHIVLAPIDLYTSAVERAVPADSTSAVLERVREHALESAVTALERMYAGLASNLTIVGE